MAKIQAQRINMKIYFRLNESAVPEREFLLNIANTVYPESIDKIMTKCYSARSHFPENNDCDMIILTPEIKNNWSMYSI